MPKMRKIVTILLIAALSLSCFSAFACGGGETEIYSISYSVADGTLPDGAISEYSESDKDISLPTPTKAGYTFAGWKNGSDVITVIAAGTKGDLYLTATWQANSYTITFNYGEGSGTEATRNVEYGSTVENLPIANAPAGKTFTAWKMENGSVFANGTAYNFENDITLTAYYTTDEYVITYHLDGGDPLPADAITAYSISVQDIPLPTTTKTGHTFTGWNNGTEIITVIAAGTVGNLDLTATWQANSYTITFNYGEGTGTETSRNVTYGSSVTDLPIATPPSEDKSFLGWKKQDNSLFNNGDQYLFDSDITLTAVFFTRFTVTLNNTTAAGFTAWADDSTGSKAVLVDVGDKLIIPAIKWDGFSETQKEADNYEFLGWFYRDKDNAERQFDPNAVFTLENLNLNTYSVTIYAKVSAQYAGPY